MTESSSRENPVLRASSTPTDQGRPLQPVKITTVVFDLDGVLIDATEWHYVALNRALGLFGYTITRYEHIADYNGLPTKKKLEMLTLQKGLPQALHPLIGALKQKYTREEIVLQNAPRFEIEYMIRRLKRDGLRLAVCSNAVRESVELMLRSAGLFDEFESCLSNEDVRAPKPDPEIYFSMFDRLQVDPAEVVIVEDAPHGIETARRSTAHVLAVTGIEDVDYFKVRTFIDRLQP